jgi:hypothetical protein
LIGHRLKPLTFKRHPITKTYARSSAEA